MRSIALKITVLVASLGFIDLAVAGPAGLTFQGRLVKNGVAVENAVDVTIKITSIAVPAVTPECLLYEETHSLNLTSSDGVFSLRIGGGTPTVNDRGLSLLTVFSNLSTALTGLTCTGSPSMTTYTPLASDSRNVYVTFVDGVDTVSFAAPYVIQSVPYALEAERLAGNSSTDFLQVTTDTTQTKLNDLMVPATYTELLALLAGTSSSFTSFGGGSLNYSSGKFYVDSSTGRVGIGTASPSLDVGLSGSAARTIGMERQTASNTAGSDLTVSAGGATSGATNKNGGSLVLSSGTATGSGTSSIEFKTALAGSAGTGNNAPSTKMTILGNGNVGVGTTSPTYKLDVIGPPYDSTFPFQVGITDNTTSALGVGGGISLRAHVGTYYTAIAGIKAGKENITVDSTAGYLSLMTRAAGAAGPTETVRISSTGNVGIGTSTPSTKLEVGSAYNGVSSILMKNADGGAGAAAKVISQSNSNTIEMTAYGNGNTGSFGGGPIANKVALLNKISGSNGMLIGSTVSAPLNLITNDATRLTILSDGKVGIGTTSPQQNLSVFEGMNIDQNSQNNGTSSFALTFGHNSGEGIGSKRTSGGNQYGLDLYTSNVARMSVTSAGNVGIGTTDPQANLHVAGQLRVDTLAAATATNVCITGSNVLASCSSASRYKENVQPLLPSLEKILKLRPVTYEWKGSHEHDLGFVAEEVEQVDPILVTYNKEGQIQGVKYNQMSSVLVKGIQELHGQCRASEAQLQNQDQRLMTLERENAELRRELNLIKNKLGL